MKNNKYNGAVKQFDETGKLTADDIMEEGVRIRISSRILS